MAQVVSKETLIINSSFPLILVDIATSEVLDEAFEMSDILTSAQGQLKEDPTLLLCVYELKEVLVT